MQESSAIWIPVTEFEAVCDERKIYKKMLQLIGDGGYGNASIKAKMALKEGKECNAGISD